MNPPWDVEYTQCIMRVGMNSIIETHPVSLDVHTIKVWAANLLVRLCMPNKRAGRCDSISQSRSSLASRSRIDNTQCSGCNLLIPALDFNYISSNSSSAQSLQGRRFSRFPLCLPPYCHKHVSPLLGYLPLDFERRIIESFHHQFRHPSSPIKSGQVPSKAIRGTRS